MSSQRSAQAHPAFPQIVRQLSADEAILLTRFARGNFTRVAYGLHPVPLTHA